MKQRYAAVIEKGDASYGAWVPDLPGCVAVAETTEQVERLIREAVEFHIEGLKELGELVPPPDDQGDQHRRARLVTGRHPVQTPRSSR